MSGKQWQICNIQCTTRHYFNFEMGFEKLIATFLWLQLWVMWFLHANGSRLDRCQLFWGFHVNVHVEIVVILVVKFLTDDFTIFQGVTHISTGSLSDAVLSLYEMFIFLLCIRRHQWSIKNLWLGLFHNMTT